MDEKEKLYSTAEIGLATGMGRGTITNRAKKLGFERNGFGYTEDQVLQMITLPLESHRKCEREAIDLRARLNRRFEDENIPIAIVSQKNGTFAMEYRAQKKGGQGK